MMVIQQLLGMSEARMIDRLISWVYTRKMFGPRCSEYEPSCACCAAWKLHDELCEVKEND